MYQKQRGCQQEFFTEASTGVITRYEKSVAHWPAFCFLNEQVIDRAFMKTAVTTTDNKYYVYLHRDLNGVVFYIGKGTKGRFKSKQSRSGIWQDIAAKGYTSQIIKAGMSNRESMILEEQLIGIYRETSVNSKSSKLTKELDFTELDAAFYYDPTSPSGLRWKTDRFKNKGAKLFSAGDVAGNRKYLANGKARCWRLKFQGDVQLVHRIIWVLVHGYLDPDMVIDHGDGNAFNNNCANLKPKTPGDNARNRKYKRKDGEVVGVIERFSPDGIASFRANWVDENGKAQCKNFSTRKYGREEAFRLACEVRTNEIEKLRLLGFDYTDRHILAQ